MSVPHTLGQEGWFCELRAKHYGAQGVVRDGSTGSALWLKLEQKERGIPVKFLMHPGAYYSSSLPGAEAYGAAQWDEVLSPLRRSGGWDLARFNLLSDAEASALARRSPYPMTRFRAHFSVLRGGRTFAEYLKSRRSSFNANQRRCQRLMGDQGMTYTRELSWDGIVSVFRSRNAVKDSGDYSVTPEFLELLREAREKLSAEGRWWEIGVVKGERLVAFTMGYRDAHGVWSAFQTAYDPEYHSLRLGALTFEHLIEWALGENCSWITFLGDSPYFEQFTPERFEYWRVDLHAYRPLGLFLWLSRRAKPWLAALRARLRTSRPLTLPAGNKAEGQAS